MLIYFTIYPWDNLSFSMALQWVNDVLPGNAAMSGSVALRAARGLGHGLARQAG